MSTLPETTATSEEITETAIESTEQFFAYDMDYSRSKKTYTNAVWKNFAIVMTLCLDVFAVIGAVFVFPEDSPITMIVMGLALIVALLAIFALPSYFNYKLKAPFKSFLADDDKLWALEFTPHKAINEASTTASAQSFYNAQCLQACGDKSIASQIVELTKTGKRLEKSQGFKKVKVFSMSNTKILKAGKNTKVSYTDAKGKTKSIKIADCYPNLFEYISK